MGNIVDIAPDRLDAEHNNRRDFSHVDRLARSIKAQGQLQPIVCYQNDAPAGEIVPHEEYSGRYTIIMGESRTRACAKLGIDVRAEIIARPGESEIIAMMLGENDGRKNTNYIEKGRAYERLIESEGIEPADLASKLGTRVDVIERALIAITLLPEYQDLVATGQLGITYAAAMGGLRPEYQKAAMDRMVAFERAHPDRSAGIGWFRAQCADLREKQNQTAFSFGSWEDSTRQEELEKAIALPPDPANYAFDFTGNMASKVNDGIAHWRQAGREWAKIGKGQKAEQCRALVAQLQAIARALDIAGRDTIEDKILSVLAEHGRSATRIIYQYANTKKAEAMPALDRLVEAGRVARYSVGRGHHYELI